MQEEIDKIRSILDTHVYGKIKAEHDVFGHHYRLPDSNLVDSVTTKLIIEKPHLRKWAVKMGIEWMEREGRWEKLATADENYRKDLISGASLAHTEERDAAGNVGTIAHDIIERYIKAWIENCNQPCDIRDFAEKGTDPRAIASARSAERLFNKHNVVPVATEMLVGSTKWGGVAGTVDLLAYFDGKLMVSDWKTSNAVSDDYALQVATYMYTFLDMVGEAFKDNSIHVHGCNLVKLSKDKDSVELYDIPYPNKAFATYKRLAGVYDWIESDQQKLIKKKNIVKL